jgi:ubiquinone/menaquinone biosynthesis C-methylase UbiE
MSTTTQQLRFHRRNRAYYADLERLHQLLVAPGLRVLEIGCGLGDLLAQLPPNSANRSCESWRPTPKRSPQQASEKPSPSM